MHIIAKYWEKYSFQGSCLAEVATYNQLYNRKIVKEGVSMEDYRLITMKDCEEVELQKCMDTIKEKNVLLYKSIMRCLKKEDFKGMRDDVLHCLADNADRFEMIRIWKYHFK